ncbi:hypothetical protein LCGC14_1292370 [marine sediment metagenome]|uniref:Uncharacterized protein n=1 Tax=marine sediment metagenome TaxID=412755 RepID=A0A0F9KTR0_9ZZZZ
MGYYMYQEDTQFFMKKDDLQYALAAVRGLVGRETINDSSGYHYPWVDNSFRERTDFRDIMDDWRWEIEQDVDESVVGLEFLGEKLGDDELLFDTIAPWVKDGSFIEMRGEDGSMWRWEFNDGKLEERS